MCLLKVDKFIKAMKDGDEAFAKANQPYNFFKAIKDLPYIQDHKQSHLLDILYPYPEIDNSTLIFNIHGGGYCYGHKEQSYVFCSLFATKGFSVVSMNYTLISKDDDATIETQITDVLNSIYFVLENKQALNLKYKKICILSDSAGGHIALIASLALRTPVLREMYGFINKENVLISKLVLSSPMYDYSRIISLASLVINKDGMKTLFSKKYTDRKFVKKHSPKYYLDMGLVIPETLIIYSKKDVFKFQSKQLIKDFKRDKRKLNIYYESDNNSFHIFHHFNLKRKTSISANEEIVKFFIR